MSVLKYFGTEIICYLLIYYYLLRSNSQNVENKHNILSVNHLDTVSTSPENNLTLSRKRTPEV